MDAEDLRVGLRVRTRYGNGVVDNEPVDDTERWLVMLDGHERDDERWLWFAPAEMAPLSDDTRLIAQLVGRRVHCIGDESVMALAKRVLELEAECHSASALERVACAKVCDEYGWSEATRPHATDVVCRVLAKAIRARETASQEASE